MLNFINKKKQDLLCFYNTVISNRSIKQNKQKKTHAVSFERTIFSLQHNYFSFFSLSFRYFLRARTILFFFEQQLSSNRRRRRRCYQYFFTFFF